MAVALKESAKVSTELAKKAREEIECGKLQPAKSSLIKAGISAANHMRQIKYLIERYTIVQKYVQEQEKDLTTDINNVLAKEQSVEKEKSAAETRLRLERDELCRNQTELKSAEKRLQNAKERKSAAETGRSVSTGIAIGAAVGTVLTLGLAAPVTVPIGVGAVGGAIAWSNVEETASREISVLRGRIANSEQKINETEKAINSLSSTVSQLHSKKSSYMSQRSRLQDEKGKIKQIIAFLLHAKLYGSNYSMATEHAIQRTALTSKLVTRADAKGYTLFDSNGTKRVLASFEEAWDAFEQMNKNGSNYNFIIDFKCTRCSNSYQQFPHVFEGRLICADCHLVM